MSMTAVELAEQRWIDRRSERTCKGCPERGTSYCAACRADMEGEGGEDGDAYTAAAITSTFIRVGTVRRLTVARSSIQESQKSPYKKLELNMT